MWRAFWASTWAYSVKPDEQRQKINLALANPVPCGGVPLRADDGEVMVQGVTQACVFDK
jgi:hypothetical protein